VTQAYPLYIAREIDRRWQRRFPIAAKSRVAQNDNRAGGGLCPLCKGYASFGTTAPESCGNGVMRHHWLCGACGHEWVTVLHVLP
jgi:hypothetical protein